MIDYINTEIVEYTDVVGDYTVGVLGPYPSTLEPKYVRIEELNLTTPWYYPYSVPAFEIKNLVSDGLIDSQLAEEHINDFYFLKCIRDVTNNQYPADDSYQLYYLQSGEVKYYRVRLYTYNLPDYYHPDLSGTDVFWLYNFGNYLMLRLDSISNLLNVSIGGYNLLYMLCGSGFLVYVGWCVLKWAIPV